MQRSQLKPLIHDFRDVFSRDSSDIGRTSQVYHSISTSDAAPIRQQPRRGETTPERYKLLMERDIIQSSNKPLDSPCSVGGQEGRVHLFLYRLPSINILLIMITIKGYQKHIKTVLLGSWGYRFGRKVYTR